MKLRTFIFNGMQNFSNAFDWIGDMTLNTGEEVSFEHAKELEQRQCEYSSFFDATLPPQPEKGVFLNFDNSHGGTREISGFVIAENKEEAKELAASLGDRIEDEG